MTGRDQLRDCSCIRARHQHGTWIAYANDKCRCRPCRDAWAAYARAGRRRRGYAQWTGPLRAHPCGTARRLQALAVAGWSAVDLAHLLNTTPYVIQCWRESKGDWRQPGNARRVAALYDRIWDKPPTGRYAVKIQRLATRKGWVPALAWDDEALDDPAGQPATVQSSYNQDRHRTPDETRVSEAVAGRRLHLTRAELTAAIGILDGMGYSARQVADRLGISARTVTRHRSRRARRKDAA